MAIWPHEIVIVRHAQAFSLNGVQGFAIRVIRVIRVTS